MTKLHLSQETIARIAYVSLFAGTQDIRYYLNGVCLHNNSEGFYAVATNGHVLACAKLGDKPLGLSVVYLALLDKAMKAFKKHDKSIGEGARFKYHGYSSPVVFEPEGVSGIKVLLMPRRV